MITIYEANATDFGGNGLGTLAPESCLVSETLNGEYEVTLVHPIDEAGKFRRLQENRILRVPVPAGKTPRMAMSAQNQTSTEIYKVTTGGMRLYLRAKPSQSAKGIHAYKPNTEVVLIAKTNAQWYEVTTPDGKHGYMWAGNLTYVRTETTGAAAEEAIKEPTILREQPFRIYRIVPTMTNITVYARHIFYDLMDNMVSSYAPDANTTGAAALTGLMAAALSPQDFTFYSDLDTTADGVEITDKNPAEAIMGDGGLIENYGGELARDWWDVYLAKRTGEETGIQIRECKNLLGITYSVDYTNVTTRIMPRGEDKDGKPLYLPEKYIDSANINAYPTIKWALIDVQDAKEKTKGDDKRTKDECYALMRQAAQDAYDAGEDLPDVTLNVSFIDCAETEEYRQYRNLQGIHLGDTVKVIAKRVGVSVAMRMTQYTYNCLTRRYEAMTLGTIDDGIEGNMINPRSIGSGSISGRMIKLGSIGTGALQDGAVNSLKIALAAINYAHIDEAAINQLSVNAVTAIRADIRQLVAGQITTDQLYADLAAIAVAQITTANISNANIDWATIANLTAAIANIANAQIGSASIGTAQIKDAKIDWAKIYDLTADTAIISEGVGGKLYIARLAVTEANMTSLTVGELMVKAEDGSFKRLTVDADGNVTAETVQVEGGNVADNTISGGKLIENTITARELNVEAIFADTALIRAIKAANIDVSDLFAAEATISALNSWLIKADTIQSLQGQLNLWASDKITAAVSAVQVGGTNLVTLGNQSLVNAGGRAAEYIGKDWYRESEHQTTISPYSGVCWLQCPGIDIAAGRKYTLSYYAWIQPGATAGEVKFRPNLFGGTSDTDKYLTDFIPFVIGTPTKYAVTFDTTGWTTGTYTLRFVMMTGQTHEVYFTDVKLEEGTKATAWSPNPNELRIGSSILMDVNHTEISTSYLDIDVSGTDGDMHIDENGISSGTATFKVVNCPDLVKATGGNTYTGGLQEAFNALNGRFLTGDVTISLSADQYGTFMLKGVYGVNASINIVGNGHSINGALAVYNCKLTNVGIGGVTINGNGSSTPLALMDAGYVSVIGVTVNGGGAVTAVDANYGTRLMMYDSGLYNANNLIRIGHCTEGSLVQLRGGSCTNYLRADGARWTMSGTRPDGTYAQENTCLHAPENPDSLTIDYGTSQPPVTPVTTASYTANVTGTYYPSGHWINDNTIRQGHEGTGSNGRKDYGCMWFNASALTGKTIKSATLTIKRISGKGRSSSVALKLWTTTLTGKSGKPTDSLVSLGEIGKIANGETATFNVPVSAISVIASGGGLVLYTEETTNKTGKAYSENYAHFEGVGGSAPVLTVTYQ